MYAGELELTDEVRTEIQRWLQHLEAWNGRTIFGSVPEMVIESDASWWGWGARCGDISTGGRWSSEELSLHVDCLELLAGSIAIRNLAKDNVKCCILLRMDNVSAVEYVNKLGGTRSRLLAEIAKDFWHYCLERALLFQRYIYRGKPT